MNIPQIGDFILLKVVALEPMGAFLGWWRPKDLFLPFSEQLREVRVGHEVVVHIYLDKADRPTATMKIEKYLKKEDLELEVGQQIEALVYSQSDMGYKAVVNGKYQGAFFKNEVFRPFDYGQIVKAYIKNIREDGKLDLILHKQGIESKDDIAPLILKELEKNSGFLPINDKSSAETIHELFGVSRKKFKVALGGLYKKRIILVDAEGVRLIAAKSQSQI